MYKNYQFMLGTKDEKYDTFKTVNIKVNFRPRNLAKWA
jgi:hypothetical protein